MKIIKGDLIEMALNGKFNVIAHGCNCYCTQKAGIAKSMDIHFNTSKYKLESLQYKGDYNKLGQIESLSRNNELWSTDGKLMSYHSLDIINAYTQYRYGKNKDGSSPIDYDALRMCMKKINHIYRGKTVGVPWIGCGLAGGNEEIVKLIFEETCKDINLIVVEYDK